MHTQENDHLLAIAKKIMENVDWRHLTTGSSGLTGQARSQLNRMLAGRTSCAESKIKGAYMENFMKIISILKMPLRIIALVCLIMGLLLFLPESLMIKLKLTEFIDEFGKYIGIVFVFSFGYLLFTSIPSFIRYCYNKYKSSSDRKKFLQKIDSTLSELTYPEKCLLREFAIQNRDVIEVPLENAEFVSL